MHIGPRIAFRRHAIERTDRFALDQNDPLVAAAHIFQIGLRDNRLSCLHEHINQRAEIFIIGAHTKHTGPAIAENRL